MNDQDAALFKARRFATSAFAAAMEANSRKFQEEMVEVRARAAAVSPFPSGIVARESTKVYAKYIDSLALAKLNSSLEGYELHGVIIDDQLAAHTVEEVMNFKDIQIAHLLKTPENNRGSVTPQVFAQLVLHETTVSRASVNVEIERRRLKPKQGSTTANVPSPFRWEELDQRLLSHKLQEISDEMQRRSAAGERKAAFDTQQSGNSAGYLGRVFDSEERLTDEWVEKIYAAHCETWVQQNRPVTGEFIRAVRDHAVMQVIAARKSTVQFQVSSRGTRINEPVNPASLGEWNRRMDRLASRWTRKLEADAVAEEYRAARPTDTNDDRRFALLALEEARKSVAEDDKSRPLVGAVVVKDGKVLAKAHRGESPKSHAEFIALEEKLKDETIADATVYTTLEPCTKRNPPKISCAQRLVDRRVARVFIGMLDPNPDIRGLGEQLLSEAGIDVQFFPRDVRSQVEELNRDFIRSHRGKSRGADSQADREPRGSTSHASSGMARDPDQVITVDATLKGKQTYHVKLRLGLRNLWGSNPTPDDRAVIEEKLDPMAGLVVEDGDYEVTYSFDGKHVKVNRRVVSGELRTA